MTSPVSVSEAAHILKVSRQRIEQFIQDETRRVRLPATKVGSFWVIEREDLEKFQEARRVT
jgi:excisionase family DNA binding protein